MQVLRKSMRALSLVSAFRASGPASATHTSYGVLVTQGTWPYPSSDTGTWSYGSNDRGTGMGLRWEELKKVGRDPGDARLDRIPASMLEALGERPVKSSGTAIQDVSNTRAACRFFLKGTVGEHNILYSHSGSSALRITVTDCSVLILQHSMAFAFRHAVPEKIESTNMSSASSLRRFREEERIAM